MTKAGLIHPAIAGDAPWQQATREYVDRLRAYYGERLAAVVLYGSRARGDADQESDVDLMVVLADEFDSTSEQLATSDLTEDLEDKFGYPLLCTIVATGDDYNRRMLPLFINVRREGIELWQASQKAIGEGRGEYGEATRADVETVMGHARATLREAEFVLRQKFPGVAANRAYYAMFHATTALLLSEGLAFSKHRGVIAAFDERWINPGRFSATVGRELRRAFKARNIADYSYKEDVSLEDAQSLVASAAAFVAEADRLLSAESSQ
jgi:uncharacterized protein (UPF0332 family)/predicted nucleotidyltransferase